MPNSGGLAAERAAFMQAQEALLAQQANGDPHWPFFCGADGSAGDYDACCIDRCALDSESEIALHGLPVTSGADLAGGLDDLGEFGLPVLPSGASQKRAKLRIPDFLGATSKKGAGRSRPN